MSFVLVQRSQSPPQRLRIYRRPGSVLVDYRILRNFVRIYQFTGFTQ
ncbi:YlcG family protein [Salmonella enterica]|nr:YlcG family protein [Salmonella enterica]